MRSRSANSECAARIAPLPGVAVAGCGMVGASPAYSPTWVSLFRLYARRYLARQFHAVRLSRSGAVPSADGVPLVVYLNHASWWDPLVVLLLAGAVFPGCRSFAPMESSALERYRIFSRLGVFGVERGTLRGAMRFLRTAESVLSEPGSILWVTPQGRFADVRERPVGFRGGLGHLARRVSEAVFAPLAIEYVFWEERFPEILLRFGPAVRVTPQNRLAGADYWTAQFEEGLLRAQDELAAESIRRDPREFEVLLRGNAGVGGIYGAWQRIKAGVAGRGSQPSHGSL